MLDSSSVVAASTAAVAVAVPNATREKSTASRKPKSPRRAVAGIRLQITIDPETTPSLFALVKKTKGRRRSQRISQLAEQALLLNRHAMVGTRPAHNSRPALMTEVHGEALPEKPAAVSMYKATDEFDGIDFV